MRGLGAIFAGVGAWLLTRQRGGQVPAGEVTVGDFIDPSDDNAGGGQDTEQGQGGSSLQPWGAWDFGILGD